MSKALLISSLRGDGSAFFVVFSFLGFTFLPFYFSLHRSRAAAHAQRGGYGGEDGYDEVDDVLPGFFLHIFVGVLRVILLVFFGEGVMIPPLF